MIFAVTANGQPARMILDTGAGTVLFGESAAAKLGISVSGEIVPGHGAGGPLELKIAELSDLSIDGKQFQNLPILISDQVEIVTAHIGLSLEGVAGYPLFSGSTLQIDFENSQFSLTSDLVEGGTPFDIGELSPLVIVRGEIGGHPAIIAIDTGASVTTVSMEFGSKLETELVPASDLQGAGGQIDSFQVPPIKVKIGGASTTLTTVLASPFVSSLSEAINQPLDAVLGLDWLKGFRLKFDYVSQLVAFE